MKPLRTRLQEARKRLGIPWEVLERDYLLSWILAGIGQVDSLRETLVFKGGTALKKCYFGDYRFSEDLDFSGLEGVPTGEAMERAVREACDAASKLLDEYAPVEIACERYTEKDPHPGGQEAFTIRARLPVAEATADARHDRDGGGREDPQARAETEDHPRVRRAARCGGPGLHAWRRSSRRNCARSSSTSRSSKSGAGAARAPATTTTSGACSGPTRDRWTSPTSPTFLREKCAVRNVAFTGPEDFFQDRMLAYVEKTWDQWLGPLVPGLPTFQTVIGELRPQIAALVPAAR